MAVPLPPEGLAVETELGPQVPSASFLLVVMGAANVIQGKRKWDKDQTYGCNHIGVDSG